MKGMHTSNFAHMARSALDVAADALALFALGCVGLGVLTSHGDLTWLWLSGAPLPDALVTGVAVAFGLAVLVARRLHATGRLIARVLAGTVAVLCLTDAARFFALRADGGLHTAAPIPLSLLIGLLLGAWSALPSASIRRSRRSNTLRRVTYVAACSAFAALGVLAHLLSFGSTDYRRPADAAVVLGAAVRPSGEPSGALRDRTTTACELYHQGLVRTLVMSGAKAPDAPISEPECMRRIALAHGVPPEAIVLDETGRTTAATMAASAKLATERGWDRLLFVSHDYHLARIKLEASRRSLTAFTVPAYEAHELRKKPLFLAREMLAFAWYLTRP